jgi:hypothetical protein
MPCGPVSRALRRWNLGYVHGRAGASRKTALDLHYIRQAGPGLDAWIFWRTLCTVADRKGTVTGRKRDLALRRRGGL